MEREQEHEDFEIEFGLGDYRARFIKRKTIIQRPEGVSALHYLLALEHEYEPREICQLCHEQKWLLIEKWMEEGGKYDERPGEEDKAEDRKLFPNERWWTAISRHNYRRARARILYREHKMPIPAYLRHPLNWVNRHSWK
jgi:hypothetical protein